MKKTLNINLAGYPFTIDEDAYNLLKDYLDTIRYAFETSEDTGELAADIESRIAELLLENENGRLRIVSLDEISRVIERIGKPSDFIEIDESSTENGPRTEEEIKIEEEDITPPPYTSDNSTKTSRNPFARKNLFRDPQNAMLGGVCAGLACYLGIDVTIVRLITVLLFFLSASTVAIVYIILWLVVPEARTPLQRMKMMGEDPTVENIGRTVTENYQENENSPYAADLKGPKGFLSSLFSVFVKCLIVIGLIVACPLLLALALALFGCIVAVFVLGVIIAGGTSSTFWMFNSASEEVLAFYILLAVIGGIITIGIPLWLLLRMTWKKKDNNPANNRALLIVWFCGIALLSVFCVKSVRKGKQINSENWRERVEIIEEVKVEDEEMDADSVTINSDGVTIQDKTGKKIVINPDGVSKTTSETVASEEIIDSISKETVTVDTIITKTTNPSKTKTRKRS